MSINWLMFGEGEMYAAAPSALPSAEPHDDAQPVLDFPEQPKEQVMAVPPILEEIRDSVKNLNKPPRKPIEIRVFFDDGTFEIFCPRQ